MYVRLILLTNVIVFALWSWGGPAINDWLITNTLVSWDGLVAGRYWILITSVFSHQLFIHLLLNMYVLSSFGTLLERLLRPKRFLLFYFAAGIVGSLAHACVSRFLLDRPDLPALGASGAIAGLILVFSLLFPKEKILLFGIIPLPALFGALAFIGLDIWGLVAQAEGGGLPIGHGAHLGGSLTGIVFYFFYLRPRLRQRTAPNSEY